jgi:hypothetical protein
LEILVGRRLNFCDVVLLSPMLCVIRRLGAYLSYEMWNGSTQIVLPSVVKKLDLSVSPRARSLAEPQSSVWNANHARARMPISPHVANKRSSLNTTSHLQKG